MLLQLFLSLSDSLFGKKMRTERHRPKKLATPMADVIALSWRRKSPLTRLPGGILEGGQGLGKIQRVIHGSAYIYSGRRRSNSRNDSPERPVTARKERRRINTTHGGKYRTSKYLSSSTTDEGGGTLLFKIEISRVEAVISNIYSIFRRVERWNSSQKWNQFVFV